MDGTAQCRGRFWLGAEKVKQRLSLEETERLHGPVLGLGGLFGERRREKSSATEELSCKM